MVTPRWQIIVPVKDPRWGKSRLHAEHRAELSRAMILDTVETAARTPAVAAVRVVSSGAIAVELAAEAVVREPDGIGPIRAVYPLCGAPAGLNPAVRFAVEVLRRGHPETPTAVLLGDLPALRPFELDAALAAASAHRTAFVRDADGVGTTLLAARDPRALEPRFGGDSAVAHRGVGAVEVGAELLGLRTDVDTVAALRAAARHGLGPRTAAVLAREP